MVFLNVFVFVFAFAFVFVYFFRRGGEEEGRREGSSWLGQLGSSWSIAASNKAKMGTMQVLVRITEKRPFFHFAEKWKKRVDNPFNLWII